MTDNHYNPNFYTSTNTSQDAFFVHITQNPPKHPTWAPSDAHQRPDSGQLGDNHNSFELNLPNEHARVPGPLDGHPNMEPFIYQMAALSDQCPFSVNPVPQVTCSPARSSTPVNHSPSRSASPVSLEHCTSYSGKEYIGLATIMVELNPFAAKHGHRHGMGGGCSSCKSEGVIQIELKQCKCS